MTTKKSKKCSRNFLLKKRVFFPAGLFSHVGVMWDRGDINHVEHTVFSEYW